MENEVTTYYVGIIAVFVLVFIGFCFAGNFDFGLTILMTGIIVHGAIALSFKYFGIFVDDSSYHMHRSA